MMSHTYKKIIWCCSILLLPLGIMQWYAYYIYKKNKTQEQQLRLEKLLRIGLILVFFEVTVIGFLFYQFGRHFIHVIGTFY